jgi:hypothetical protein
MKDLSFESPVASGLYCLHVCLRVKPERRAEFLSCIEANQRGTLTTGGRYSSSASDPLA